MGRNPVTIKIDGDALRSILKDHDLNFSERAKSYGVSKQALNGWLSNNRIPPRALIEMALDLKFHPEQLNRVIVNTKDESESPAEKKKWQITIEEL